MTQKEINAGLICDELAEISAQYQRALITSAAALTSKTENDVGANSELALAHLGTMTERLNRIWDIVSSGMGGQKIIGHDVEIDAEKFIGVMTTFSLDINLFKELLLNVLTQRGLEKRNLLKKLFLLVGRLGKNLHLLAGFVNKKDQSEAMLTYDCIFSEAIEGRLKDIGGRGLSP